MHAVEVQGSNVRRTGLEPQPSRLKIDLPLTRAIPALDREVCLSKIGPAGAGWWAANAYADSIGYAATDVGYFAITGLGDASAVLLGHSVYFVLKKLWRPDISVVKELQTGTHLAGATFLSGFAWQPICNVLAEQPFLVAAAGVGAGILRHFMLNPC